MPDKSRRKDGRGKNPPRLTGEQLIKSCIDENGCISSNCMFRMIMGFDDSRLRVDKTPYIAETILKSNQRKSY